MGRIRPNLTMVAGSGPVGLVAGVVKVASERVDRTGAATRNLEALA